MGAQTWTSKLAIGGFSTTVQMPSNAGDCAVPETCADLGTIMIGADDCTSAPPDNVPSGGGCLERIAPLREQADACGTIYEPVLSLERMCDSEAACPAEVEALLSCLEANGLACYNQCAEFNYFDVNSPDCDPEMFACRDCILELPAGTTAMSAGDDPEPLYKVNCP